MREHVSTRQRLERLETDNRRLQASVQRLRQGIAASALLASAVLLTGATAPVPEIVRAKRFAVVSEDGARETLVLATTPYGSGLLTVYQNNGYPAVELDTAQSIGGMMTVFDDRGYPMVRAEVTAPHDGLLTGFNAGGHRLFRLGADRGSEGYSGGALQFEDGQGRVSARFPAVTGSNARPGGGPADSANLPSHGESTP